MIDADRQHPGEIHGNDEKIHGAHGNVSALLPSFAGPAQRRTSVTSKKLKSVYTRCGVARLRGYHYEQPHVSAAERSYRSIRNVRGVVGYGIDIGPRVAIGALLQLEVLRIPC